MGGVVSVTEPLEDGDGDGVVEGGGAEGEALTDVVTDEVARDGASEGDTEHGGGDVEACPVVTGVSEGLTGEAGATTDVEEVERRRGGREGEELEGTLGHAGLDFHHTRTEQGGEKGKSEKRHGKEEAREGEGRRRADLTAYFFASMSL